MANFADRIKAEIEKNIENNPIREDFETIREKLEGLKISMSVDEFIFDSITVLTVIVGVSADDAADFVLSFLTKNQPEAVDTFIDQIMKRRK